MLSLAQRDVPIRLFDIARVVRTAEDTDHLFVANGAAGGLVLEARLAFQEALDLGLAFKAPGGEALQGLFNDGGHRLVTDQQLAVARHALVRVVERRNERPIAAQRTGAHAVPDLLGVLLALMLGDGGQQVLDEDRIGILAELDARAFQLAAESVDVLFVDEAAQMALPNVLAVSQAAKTLILIGDPQQLGQPIQGSHPDGCDVSALHHILEGAQTIAADRGLFLEETWRLHPDICGFTSELFYADQLRPRHGLEGQIISGETRLAGAGLRYLPVAHSGNQNNAPEEAAAIAELVNEVIAAGADWTDRDGETHPVTLDDILIITPYNAQVFEIQQRLPGARVGTVDKFQGQEAPIAIYSTATSSHADAPRGMEFLYSLNRFNVATSRAKCVSVLFSSPQLFEAECRTPQQMQLANAFCRYLELAQPIET